LQEQQLAKDIVVAWLSLSASSNSVISDTIRNPTTAGNRIADVFKTIVQAIHETSSVATGTDAIGYLRQNSMTSRSERGALRLKVEGRDAERWQSQGRRQ
jgi:hypothetical protein